MTREQNRADFPVTAAWVDSLRAAFGHGVKLIYLEESGQTRGKPESHPPARSLHAGQLTLRAASPDCAPNHRK